MDALRFDALARSLSTASSRRRALVAAFSGVLSVLGLADLNEATAAKSGKCKRKPGECETCKKGKCERKHGKKRCKAGKIQPKANGTACSSGTCQNAQCITPTGQIVSPPPPPGCVPESQATTCAPGCGDRLNNCNQPVTCPCPSGQTCLPNGTCARPCPAPGGTVCADCTQSAGCSFPSSEGPLYCVTGDLTCANLQTCDPANTTGCPRGFVCVPCGMSGPRCTAVAVCPPT